jgi:uncharacterized protein (UPF0276 family)
MMSTATEQTQPRRCAVGVTYEGGDARLLERMLPLVEYLEVTPETISEVHDGELRLSPDIMAELKSLGPDVQIVLHGVSLSIGSHDGWSDSYLRLADEFMDQIDVAWHSEHLGYTKVDGQHLGIMLALPKTDEVLDILSERVNAIQARYRLPFLIENIVHVIPDAGGTYSDAAFLNALTQRTGCGLILDTYNLECDAHNHRFDIEAFLAEIDATRVRELHVACGVEHNGFLLDVHSKLTRPSTVQLAQRVIADAPGHARAVVFEFMPEAVDGLGHDAIESELQRLNTAFGG